MGIRSKTGMLFVMAILSSILECVAQPNSKHNLTFDHLAKRWDEAMPLGNGMLGVLIWEKTKQASAFIGSGGLMG